jgi:outer membrane protein TolC
MSISRNVFFILLSFAFSAASALADCGNPASAKELLDCVLKNDPRILASAEQVKRSEALVRAAGAWSNPEVEGNYSRSEGALPGERISASLSQKVEWGSRESAAKLEWEARQAEHRLLRQEILGEATLKLVRLTQIGEEQKLVESQARLCERGLQKFKGLAFLTSEQRAGKQALEWGQERLKLEILRLEVEAADIRLELSTSLGGQEFLAVLEIPHKTTWPTWPASSAGEPPVLVAESKRLESIRAEAGKENAAAWPSFSLGPVFERENDGGSSRDFFGGQISLGLPLWNRNEGNRDATQSSVREGEIRKNSMEKRLELKRRLLKDRYGKAVGHLAGLELKVDSGAEKLAAIRADYLEGRLALPLALEAYREMEELTKHFHETERMAYESLWRGYALEDVAENQTP